MIRFFRRNPARELALIGVPIRKERARIRKQQARKLFLETTRQIREELRLGPDERLA
jgi:hypothetical protein